MKKYKYSRKEWFEKWKHIGIGPDPKKDLLSTLPSDKEEKKCLCPCHKGNTDTCFCYCNSPSPLEGIEEIKLVMVNKYGGKNEEFIAGKINSLIHNQNLIINHLKHL